MEQTAKSLRNARKGDPVQPEGMPPPRFNMPVDVRSMALSVLAVLAIIFTLRMAREVFLPVVISILFSYALNPVVNWLAAWKVPRWLSSAFLLTGLVVLLTCGSNQCISQDDATALAQIIYGRIKTLLPTTLGGGK